MDTIIFDVDDTLYDQAQSFHKTVRKLFQEPFSDEEIDELYRASRKYSEILFDQSEAGEITQFEWQTGRIMAACKDFNIPIDTEKATIFHETYVTEQKNITLFPEVEELLNVLHKEGKQLGILTNGEEKHQAMKMKQLNLSRWIPAEMTFISGSIGHAKPKREVFDFIEEKMDLDQTKTVYIGDNFEKDIIGAKQAGWQAIWMNHRKKNLPTYTTYKPDKEVHSAKELLELLVKKA
ncbi:HAD family hydrolase [Halalkalibacter krulwichiae]|uniref:Pyrimidine 5'-nucleotidase YjjG n=1 Tax=Halalkalibacter krulwichiae TaxID=199441 RepID=A0A1X9M9B4_9BACI|nr:HAD family hydrolase [Halalkalibacter krulwichiae]ARK30049.1 Pyrimidine 5'-nucleotidase YjjG [Halalkalibacter krulwichiae]